MNITIPSLISEALYAQSPNMVRSGAIMYIIYHLMQYDLELYIVYYLLVVESDLELDLNQT